MSDATLGPGGAEEKDPFDMSPEEAQAELERIDRERPEEGVLMAYLDDELDAEARRAVEDRLREDDGFARQLSELVQVQSVIREELQRARAAGVEDGGRVGGDGRDEERSDTRGTWPRRPVTSIGRFLQRTMFGTAAFFLVGITGAWVDRSYVRQVEPYVQATVRRGKAGANPSPNDSREFRNADIWSVVLDENSSASYEDTGMTTDFPKLPGQHEIELRGGGTFDVTLPTSRQLFIRHTFVTLRMRRAKVKVTYVPPCTTTVTALAGILEAKSPYVSDSTNLLQGDRLLIGCDLRFKVLTTTGARATEKIPAESIDFWPGGGR